MITRAATQCNAPCPVLSRIPSQTPSGSAQECAQFSSPDRGVQWRASTHANPARISCVLVKSDTRWGEGGWVPGLLAHGRGDIGISTAGHTRNSQTDLVLFLFFFFCSLALLQWVEDSTSSSDNSIRKKVQSHITISQSPTTSTTAATCPSRTPPAAPASKNPHTTWRPPSRPSTAGPAASSQPPPTMMPPPPPPTPRSPGSQN